MPLPQFREDGWLPQGHHATTWEEITARFGGQIGSRRDAVLSSLLKWREAARAKGMAGLVILNGSFISGKEAPGDFDLVFLYNEATEALVKTDAEARALTDMQSCHQAGFRGDIFALPLSLQKLSPMLGGTDMFDKDRQGTLKGVVEVTL